MFLFSYQILRLNYVRLEAEQLCLHLGLNLLEMFDLLQIFVGSLPFAGDLVHLREHLLLLREKKHLLLHQVYLELKSFGRHAGHLLQQLLRHSRLAITCLVDIDDGFLQGVAVLREKIVWLALFVCKLNLALLERLRYRTGPLLQSQMLAVDCLTSGAQLTRFGL